MKVKELKNLKSLEMTDLEKKELFGRVSKRISAEDTNVSLSYPTPSPFYAFSHSLGRSMYLRAGVFSIFIVLLTGATAFASMNTLPGDLLYEVKTNVVEKIPRLLHVSQESKAKDDFNIIEKRIAEFEKLAEKGKLNEKNTKKIEKEIHKNVRNFDNHVREIKRTKVSGKDEKIEIEHELQSKLEKHSEKLRHVRGKDEASTNPN